ncbi:MAG: AMP-binding protein, partial [Terrimicrobiaceae bacterium]|nr:AMP-binding protein [Terrimicrobiaceae bacterium]
MSFGEEVAPGALREAWQAVAAARPRLRFAYRKLAGEGLRAIEDPRASPEWRELDWSGLPPDKLAAQWQAEFQGVRAPDPSLAPPLRLVVITLPDRSTHLLAAHPQFVFDEEDWFDILCELLEALSGRQPVAADSGSPMPDGQPIWKDLLRGFQPSPLRYYGPGERGDFSLEMAMSRDFTAGLAAACREAGADSGAAILACWSALLSRLTGDPRPLLLAPVGEMISLFQPFRLPALENPGLRELLVLAAGEQRRRSSSPPETFEALGLHPADAASLVRILPPSLNDRISDALPRWINLDARLHSPPLHSLELTVRSGPRLELALRGRGLPREVARQMLGWLEDFLAGLLEGGRAGDIRLAEDIEPAPPAPPGAAPAESLFAEAASAHGDSLAIEDPTGAGLTFREVEDYASIFSGWLCAQGLGEGWIAGVCLSLSPWVPVTWIALLRAGNTLLPLDPAAPPEWLRRKAADSDAQFVVCDSSTVGHFEGCGLKIVVVDREWESIASTPLPARFPEPARTALILGGSPCQPPPLAAIP